MAYVQHVVVFLNAAGAKMYSVGTAWTTAENKDAILAADRVEEMVRSGTYGSMKGLTFVERQVRDDAWRAANRTSAAA